MTFARNLRRNKTIMGMLDEGCMGMYNTVIPDELLHSAGVFKERLSQSTLYAKILSVSGAGGRSGRSRSFEWRRIFSMTGRSPIWLMIFSGSEQRGQTRR